MQVAVCEGIIELHCMESLGYFISIDTFMLAFGACLYFDEGYVGCIG